jgi:hypothetical protein
MEYQNSTIRKFLWLIVGGAFILAGLVLIGEFCFDLASNLKLSVGSFRLELLKGVWQFFLVAVLGGAVGLFFKLQEREGEQRAARKESLLRTRADLVKAYQKAKKIRRLLRSSAFEYTDEHKVVRRSEYNSLLGQLIEAQLEFEYYVELVEPDRQLFSPPDALKARLKCVERYLHEIIGEFEDAWEKFAKNDQAPLDEFENLKEFVQCVKHGTPFDVKFKKPFHEALRLIECAAGDPPKVIAVPSNKT